MFQQPGPVLDLGARRLNPAVVFGVGSLDLLLSLGPPVPGTLRARADVPALRMTRPQVLQGLAHLAVTDVEAHRLHRPDELAAGDGPVEAAVLGLEVGEQGFFESAEDFSHAGSGSTSPSGITRAQHARRPRPPPAPLWRLPGAP